MSQNETVMNLLRRRPVKGVTPQDAWKEGITRLAARIHELRRLGHDIGVDTSKGYATYWLIEEAKQAA